jgi:hypothetical protein
VEPVNIGLDALADMFQMDDDYDNGVVVADMSSALPERQVDYSSIHGDDPLGTPEAQSVLHRAERVIAMSRAAVAD